MKIFNEIPDIKNPVFKLRSCGGYYDGIAGKPQIYLGSGLNNCTCGAWGLFALFHNNINIRVGCGDRNKNAPYDAGLWLDKSPDFKKGNEPKLGSIIVYDNHVAFINEIKENGDLVLIESGYNAKNMSGLWFRTVKSTNSYYIAPIYGNFKGFIYPNEESFITFEIEQNATLKSITTEEAIDKMARDVIAGKYGTGVTRKNKLYQTIQSRVNSIIKNGG